MARGARKFNLHPFVEGEGRQWRFAGIWSKNRAEWTTTHFANMYYSVTTIGFFDAMGPQSVDFILNQTELTTIYCSGEYVKKLLAMKKDGLAKHIVNLVSFDSISSE